MSHQRRQAHTDLGRQRGEFGERVRNRIEMGSQARIHFGTGSTVGFRSIASASDTVPAR